MDEILSKLVFKTVVNNEKYNATKSEKDELSVFKNTKYASYASIKEDIKDVSILNSSDSTAQKELGCGFKSLEEAPNDDKDMWNKFIEEDGFKKEKGADGNVFFKKVNEKGETVYRKFLKNGDVEAFAQTVVSKDGKTAQRTISAANTKGGKLTGEHLNGEDCKDLSHSDGKIYSFKSVEGKDMALLGSLYSLIRNEKGFEAIKNSIKKKDDASVDVYLKGIDETINVKQEDLNKEGKYSKTDVDTKIVEIAISKLYSKIEQSPELSKKCEEKLGKNSYPTSLIDRGNNKNNLYGNLTGTITKLFTDKDNEICVNANDEESFKALKKQIPDAQNDFKKFFEKFKSNPDKYSSSLSLYKDYGSIKASRIITVKEVSDDFVSVIDPYNSNVESKIPFKDFASCVYEANLCNLS